MNIQLAIKEIWQTLEKQACLTDNEDGTGINMTFPCGHHWKGDYLDLWNSKGIIDAIQAVLEEIKDHFETCKYPKKCGIQWKLENGIR